jgi:50S ribosomal subunit-associated GTPase HflX
MLYLFYLFSPCIYNLRAMSKLKCTCVIFDVELTPSQQKNLELAFNQELNNKSGGSKSQQVVKVLDRTALILDIFAQHAKTKEGQLQVRQRSGFVRSKNILS